MLRELLIHMAWNHETSSRLACRLLADKLTLKLHSPGIAGTNSRSDISESSHSTLAHLDILYLLVTATLRHLPQAMISVIVSPRRGRLVAPIGRQACH